jgi:hypothetical protein
MLSALVPKGESCREALSAQHTSNCLCGMQAMSSDSAEVRAKLLALVLKVESCREVIHINVYIMFICIYMYRCMYIYLYTYMYICICGTYIHLKI